MERYLLIGLMCLLLVTVLWRAFRRSREGEPAQATLQTNYWLWWPAGVGLLIALGFVDPLTGLFGGDFNLWSWVRSVPEWVAGIPDDRNMIAATFLLVLKLLLLVLYAVVVAATAFVGGWVFQGVVVALARLFSRGGAAPGNDERGTETRPS